MVVWTSAWLHGVAASDDLLDALQTWGEAHEVRAGDDELSTALDLPGPDETPAGPALLLAALRRAGGRHADLVLPVPGDARGLDGTSPFSREAMRANEAVVLREAHLGLVPHPVPEGILRWTVHRISTLPPSPQTPLGEAEHAMSTAMREAASTLAELDVSGNRPGARDEVARAAAKHGDLPWPAEVPQRSLRVLQRAGELDAILHVATADTPGGATSASAMQVRADALRPLFTSVRDARCTAIAEMVRVLAERATQA